MIIHNGTLLGKRKTGGGLDENGNPVHPKNEWEYPIPCHIRVNRRNNLGKQNGNTFVIASYEILIDPDEEFSAERVRLIDNHDGDLGEFSVMFPPEYLEAVEAIKIVV